MIANEALPLCRADQNSCLKPVYYATETSQCQPLSGGQWLFLVFSVARFHASNLLDPLLISVAVIKLISAVGKVVFARLFWFSFVRPLFVIASSKPRFYNFEPPADKSLEVKATEPPATLSSMLSIVIAINIIRTETRVEFIQN